MNSNTYQSYSCIEFLITYANKEYFVGVQLIRWQNNPNNNNACIFFPLQHDQQAECFGQQTT